MLLRLWNATFNIYSSSLVYCMRVAASQAVCMYVCIVTYIARVWINANPARDQLNRENEYFPVRVRA